MAVPAAVQIRIRSPEGLVKNWSLPAWILGMTSYTVSQALGTEPSVVVNPRVAREMNIQDGDEVDFEFVEAGKAFRKPVVVKECAAPVTIHGAVRMGLFASETIAGDKCELEFPDGGRLEGQMQELWAGMKVVDFQGSGVLTFDGASRNDPSGPAGYGFCIRTASTRGVPDKDLIKGYGYYRSGTSNQLEYKGLLEGLSWALQLDLEKLWVRGDSELVIRQCQGVYEVSDTTLEQYHSKIMELVQDAEDCGTDIVFERIPREQNTSKCEQYNRLCINKSGRLRLFKLTTAHFVIVLLQSQMALQI